PLRDLYLLGLFMPGQLFAVPAATPGAPPTALTFAGTTPPRMEGCGLQYRSATDEFLLVDSSTLPPNQLYVLTPPATNPLTNAWTWSIRTFAGSSQFSNTAFSSATGVTAAPIFNRFQYVAVFDALIVCP